MLKSYASINDLTNIYENGTVKNTIDSVKFSLERCCEQVEVTGLKGIGSGVYQALPLAFAGKTQYRSLDHPNIYIYHNKENFMIGEKSKSGFHLLRSKNGRSISCPMEIDEWTLKVGKKKWNEMPNVRVHCVQATTTTTTTSTTTSTTSTTTTTTTTTRSKAIPAHDEARLLAELIADGSMAQPVVMLKQVGKGLKYMTIYHNLLNVL